LRISPVLAAALFLPLLARPARADVITPDMVGLTPDVLITDQYRGLGLVFKTYAEPGEFGPRPYGTHDLGGAWWGLTLFGTAMSQTAEFVVPGTGDSATTDTLRLQIASAYRSRLTVDAFGLDGGLVRSFSMITEDGYVGQWVTLQGPGIRSFTAREDWWDPPGQEQDMYYNHPGWGIDAVEFLSVAAVPEPGSLALALLGAGGLVARRWRLR
jgi:hypothetical protein